MPHNKVIVSTAIDPGATVAKSDASAVSVPTVQTLLGEVLEICIHELLFQRSVYPRDLFVTSRDYLGIRHHVASHEDLCTYIVDALDVAVPAMCSGLADKVSLDILDANNNEIIESYIFEIDSALLANGMDEWNAQKVSILEQHFKSLVLKIVTLEGRMMNSHFLPNNNAKFKLRLHTNGVDLHGCREFQHAVGTGTWRRSSDKLPAGAHPNDDNLVIRSIKSVHVPECLLRMECTVQFLETDE